MDRKKLKTQLLEKSKRLQKNAEHNAKVAELDKIPIVKKLYQKWLELFFELDDYDAVVANLTKKEQPLLVQLMKANRIATYTDFTQKALHEVKQNERRPRFKQQSIAELRKEDKSIKGDSISADVEYSDEEEPNSDDDGFVVSDHESDPEPEEKPKKKAVKATKPVGRRLRKIVQDE